jgi:photosystem I reaction center subunit VIII
MISSYLPAIFVPIVGIAFPLISMALFFIYVEQEDNITT